MTNPITATGGRSSSQSATAARCHLARTTWPAPPLPRDIRRGSHTAGINKQSPAYPPPLSGAIHSSRLPTQRW
jgi:hypothetical protein